MLQSTLPRQSDAQTTGYDVELAGIATAVPQYKYSQADALERARYLMPRCSYLAEVYDHTGIETRYSCVPMDWYKNRDGWKESNPIYVEASLDLLEQVADQALEEAKLARKDVDAIITVSTTGLAIPSLDALLINRMGLSNTAERLPIFGLGCAGGTSGFARASRIAHSMPGGTVLLLVVELAGINVHVNERSPALFVSAALFGDGAAGLVLRNWRDQTKSKGSALCRVVATGEHLWPDTGYIMGWKVEDDGLDVILSSTLPEFTRDNLKSVASTFLERHNLSLEDIEGYVFHPGGRKVLEAIQETLEIDEEALQHAWYVLKNYGNMSAPTVLFILEQTLREGASGRHLMTSFGPGFTATFAVLDL